MGLLIPGTMLDSKLQIKAGQTIAVLHAPGPVAIAASKASPDKAHAVLVFATNRAELDERVDLLTRAARRGALVWVAYPKFRQLGTDLNRDLIHEYMPGHGLHLVRQIAIDEMWSALRLKPLGE